MLLRDLVAAPELHLRLLHEPSGALDQPVGRVVTTDLLEPSRYLSGGELVISGLVWRRSPADSETFAASLAEGGATALAAGDALLGSIPDDLVEACRRHRLALVEVPVEIAFADVAEHVATAESQRSGVRVSASLVRQRQLLSAIAAGRSLDELAARVSTEVDRECRVVTVTGRHVVAGPRPLGPGDLDEISRAYLRATRLPTIAHGAEQDYSVFPVGSTLSNRLASWMVVAEGRHTDWPEDAVEAVNELAAIASLDRSRRDEGVRAVRHIAEEALGLVEAGAGQVEIALRLKQAGLDSGASLVVAVAAFPGRAELLEVARTLTDDVALEFGPPVVAVRGSHVVALLPATDQGEQVLRASLARVAAGVGRDRLCVGLSRRTGLDALAGALEEARFAFRLAEARTTPVSVVAADEVTSHVLLLATVPDDVRRTFAARVLGKVLEYDERNASGLVETLEAFMACSGSWSRTAEALHLHVNTVRYRIERVEDLTGRDLSRLEDRVDVFLALRSL